MCFLQTIDKDKDKMYNLVFSVLYPRNLLSATYEWRGKDLRFFRDFCRHRNMAKPTWRQSALNETIKILGNLYFIMPAKHGGADIRNLTPNRLHKQ